MFGGCAGCELRQPLGFAVAGGLIVSQALTLLTTPVIYLYLERLSQWRQRQKGGKQVAGEDAQDQAAKAVNVIPVDLLNAKNKCLRGIAKCSSEETLCRLRLLESNSPVLRQLLPFTFQETTHDKKIVSARYFSAVDLACSNEPPKCSDPQTISLLKQIVLEKLGIDAAGQEKIGKGILEKALYVENTRPSGYDEKIKKFTCDGTLIANSTSAVGVYRLPIQYESQFDDKKDHIVAVHNVAIGDLRQIDLYLAAAIAEAEKAKESAAPKPAPPPAPATVPDQPATPDPAATPAAAVQTASAESVQLAEKNTVESAGICKGLDLAITFDQSECVSRKFKVADKKLNEDYAKLMAALPVARKAALKQEQIGWIKEKTAKCEQAGKEFEGGSMQPIIIVDCEVKMTEQRTGYLADFK